MDDSLAIRQLRRREAALMGEWEGLVKAVNQVDRAIASPMYCGDDVEKAFYRLVDAIKSCRALFEKPDQNHFYDLLTEAHQSIHSWASRFFLEQNARWKLEREISELQGTNDERTNI